MTIPPEVLLKNGISFEGRILLVSAAGEVEGPITAHEAEALATLGEIEAVTTSGGRIKCFRYLPEHIRHKPIPPEPRKDESFQSTSSGFARTNIGVYREPIVAHSESKLPFMAGFVIGYCYAHCQLRGSGL